MQVQVHHVHAEVPGARLAHQRIHVGAVHVEQRALGVENVGDLVNLALEHADGAGVGQHQRRRVLGDDLLQLRHIHHPQRIGCEGSLPGNRKWLPWPGWFRARNRG